ncbi:MAG: hypothetical protein QGH12_08170, partial [SAR324 cluster bacterium]|nr:hypothetical protein [SAR324 cluster bacterium]
MGSILELEANLAATGTLGTNHNTTFTLNGNTLDLSGGRLEVSGALTLDGLTFDESSVLALNADASITSAQPLTLKTVELGAHRLLLGSATTDLTISESLTINYPGANGLNSGEADLTFNGPVNVLSSRIVSSGGIITFGAESTFSPEQNAGLILQDSTLNLQVPLAVPGLLSLTGDFDLQLNGNALDLSGGGLELGSNLDLTDLTTDNETDLKLTGDVTLTSDVPVSLGLVLPNGFTLSLGSTEMELTARGLSNQEETTLNSATTTVQLDPVIESLSGERLVDGTLRWTVRVSDDGTFANLSSHWEYLAGDSRTLENPEYTDLTDPEQSLGGYGRIQAVMSDYQDTDAGILRVTVCEGATNHIGTCAYGQEASTSTYLELVTYAYQRPLVCDEEGVCSGPDEDEDEDVPDNTTGGTVPEEEPEEDSPDNTSIDAGGRTGVFLAQGADVTFTETQQFEDMRVVFGGGTLHLAAGATLEDTAELDLSDSVLQLSKRLHNNGGTLTTTGATLQLTGNAEWAVGGAVAFGSYLADGWGLLLSDNTTHLTLNSDVQLQASAEAQAMGFAFVGADNASAFGDNASTSDWGGNNASLSRGIGIGTNHASLTITGTITLKDNASLDSSGGVVELNGGILIDNGSFTLLGGSATVAGGTVGSAGTVWVQDNASLSVTPNASASSPMTVSGGLLLFVSLVMASE